MQREMEQIIKASDLMVNDYALVELVPDVWCLYKMKPEGYRGAVRFKAIELTDDILKANGFVRKNEFYMYLQKGEIFISIYHDILSIQIHGEKCAVIMQYKFTSLCVHEFQQLLRTCKVKELKDFADNIIIHKMKKDANETTNIGIQS